MIVAKSVYIYIYANKLGKVLLVELFTVVLSICDCGDLEFCSMQICSLLVYFGAFF